MRRRLPLALGAILVVLSAARSALAHGNVIPPVPPPYGGPGDTSGGGGSTPGAPGPAMPGPSTSGPSGPSTPPGGGPGGGGQGGSPGSTPTGGPLGPGLGSGGSGGPIDAWEMWWRLNKEPYLDLKRAVHTSASASREDDLLAGSSLGGPPNPDVVRGRVVPALRKLLDDERSNDIVTGALVALARIGEAPGLRPESSCVPRFVRALADGNQEIAETATLALGILHNEDGIPLLEALLFDEPRGRELAGGHEVPLRTRAFAAYGLGLAAEHASRNRTRQMIARSLFRALDADHTSTTDVQVAAVLALSLDPVAIEAVESTSAPWISRQTVVRGLMTRFADLSRKHLVRANAATALARLALDSPEDLRAEAGELLLATLRKEPRAENEVVQSCVQALGVLGNAGGAAIDVKIRAALARAIDEPDVQARWLALIALGEAGARPSPAASSGVNGSKPGDGESECRALLQGELAKNHSSTRPWAALALGVLERRRMDRGAAPSEATRAILRDLFGAVRQRRDVGAAAIALGLARDPQAVPLLRARLEQTNEDTGQGYIALALGMLGAVDATPPLRAIVRGSKYRPVLLEQAAEALALLGDKQAAPELAALLVEAQGTAAQAAISGALGFIGDARSVEPLLHHVANASLTASTRGFAATALGRVADPAPLPWFVPLARDWNWNTATPALVTGNGTGLLEIL